MTDWQRLGLEPTTDLKKIKLAYADLLKTYHPEEDPEGFMQLQQAYQRLLKQVRRQNEPLKVEEVELEDLSKQAATDGQMSEDKQDFAYLQEEYEAEQFLVDWLEDLPMVVTFERLLSKLTALDGQACWNNPFFYPLIEEALLNCYPHGNWQGRRDLIAFCKKHGLYQLEAYFSQVGLSQKQVAAEEESNEIIY